MDVVDDVDGAAAVVVGGGAAVGVACVDGVGGVDAADVVVRARVDDVGGGVEHVVDGVVDGHVEQVAGGGAQFDGGLNLSRVLRTRYVMCGIRGYVCPSS